MARISRGDFRALALLGISSLLIQLPFLDRALSPIDEGSMLAIAESLSGGEVLYRDRATFISPLMYEWIGALLHLFGSHLLVGRVFQLFVFSGTVVAVYGLLRAFVGVRFAAISAFSIYALKPLALPLWTIPNYNQLAMLLALVAMGSTLLYLRAPGRGRLVATGLVIGLAVATKLSLGGAVALAVVATIALDAWLQRSGPSFEWGRRLALLTGASCLPVAAFLLYYASNGALDALIERTLRALGGVSTEMRVPLPSPWIWKGAGDEMFRLQYEYYPPPVFTWSLLRGFDFYESALGRVMEGAVKVAYYGPLLATGLGLAVAGRELLAARREPACRWLLVGTFSALAYLSTAHRLDFAHVLSIAPAPLLVCAVTLHRWGDARRVVASSVFGVWMLAGVLASAAVFDAYDTTLETSRGRVRATAEEVADASALLEFLDATPREAHALLMRTLPLFYFLSDRPIFGPFDLFLPGYFRPGEDEVFARSIAEVDVVLYNPNELLGIPKPITEFAPDTARALADRFEITRQLSPTALVLDPRPGGPERRTVVVNIARDFDRIETGAREGRVELASWIVYPVVTTRLQRADRAVCFNYSHTASAGEVLSVRPMFEHLAWTHRHWPDAARRVFASVHARAGGVGATLFAEERRAGIPGPPLEIPLAAYSGQPIELRFCARRLPKGPGTRGVASFGWADPRILRDGPVTTRRPASPCDPCSRRSPGR